MIDPLAKAAECERAIKACTDREDLQALTSLRALWLTIENQRAEGLPDWKAQAARIEKLHLDVLGLPK